MTATARHMLGALAVATALAAAPALADVKAGVDAWASGRYEQAIKEWRPLADRGDADAQFNMGQAYKLGRGVPADLKIAQAWFEKAAARGHEEAQGNAGVLLFQNGNRTAALPLLRKAADRGDARAQYILGTLLFNGEGIEKDWPRAYAYMTRAAGQGLPAAARSLGQMEQFVPAPERQKGIALARQMDRGARGGTPQVAASAPSVGKPAAPAPKPTAIAKAPGPVAKPVAAPAVGSGSGWRAQLGAYGSPAAAQAQWTALSRKIPGLGGLRPSYEKAGALTRLRAGPLASRAAVDKICASAKAVGQPCFPVAP